MYYFKKSQPCAREHSNNVCCNRSVLGHSISVSYDFLEQIYIQFVYIEIFLYVMCKRYNVCDRDNSVCAFLLWISFVPHIPWYRFIFHNSSHRSIFSVSRKLLISKIVCLHWVYALFECTCPYSFVSHTYKDMKNTVKCKCVGSVFTNTWYFDVILKF